jgi:F-type H+-transporting ATPase subunit delta
MRATAVAKRYARALLALAKADGDPAALGDALARAAAAFTTPAVRDIVTSPAVGADARMMLVRRLVDGLGLPSLVANCLYLLSERRRLDIVGDLTAAYVALLDDLLGRSRVVVRSAIPLSQTQVDGLLPVLRARAGVREVIPVLEIDPDLLGGVVVEVGGVVYDGSVRTQVDRLARRMAVSREA